MANADMNRLMDNARVKLPGALDATIQLELFAVVNEFFQTSNLWYEDIAFSVTPTTQTYLENPSAYTYELIPLQDGTINRLMTIVDSAGFPQAGIMPTPGSVILQHSPNKADTFTARVAKTVTDPTATDGSPIFPEWVMNKYGNEILDGVLGRMMAQIAKPYSSPALAALYVRKFRQSVSRAKAEAMHGNLYRGQSWRFPSSFSARHY
jgi:hypothetical protein